MHASMWKFEGDPDDLSGRYEAMLGDIPAEVMQLHLGLRCPDGLLVVDTCPSPEAFAAFAAGAFPALRARHGLPDPVAVEDHPVLAAFVHGRREV